jgi:hypothetical protein
MNHTAINLLFEAGAEINPPLTKDSLIVSPLVAITKAPILRYTLLQQPLASAVDLLLDIGASPYDQVEISVRNFDFGDDSSGPRRSYFTKMSLPCLGLPDGDESVKAVTTIARSLRQINILDKDGDNLIALCAMLGSEGCSGPRIMEALLDAGASPHILNNRGESPLHYLANAWNDDEGHALRMMKVLFTASVSLDDYRNENHYAPLHVALRRRNFQIAKALMEAGASVDNQRWCGETPLHILAIGRHVYTLVLDITIVSHEETEESLDCLDALLARNPSLENLDGLKCDLGKTAFHLAVEKRNYKTASRLIDAGASINKTGSDNTNTPMDDFAWSRSKAALNLLSKMEARGVTTTKEIEGTAKKAIGWLWKQL